uniref:Putative translocase of outer mitochondrial membrane complex subunit n=1 Tax=Triatoma dimidiata TaxID=72491 RepID=A0A0V0G443_TRIDM
MTESGTAPNYSLSKWLIAMAIGLPTFGYVFYCYHKTSHKEETGGSKKPNKEKDDEEFVQENGCTKETSKEEGPLERALSLKNSGNDFFKQRMQSEAIRCYTEAIDLCPKDQKEYLATFYQNRAAAHEVLNNLEEVIKDCNEAIKLKHNYTKALTRRYKNHEKLGNLRQALEDVTACCLLEQFGNADTLNAADRILKALGVDEAKKFQISRKPVLPSKQFVKSYFSSYEHDPILLSLNQLSGMVEGVPSETGINAAKIALRDERYEDILGHCNEEIADPRHNSESPSERYLEALLLRATIYSLTSQTKLALEDLDLIINSKPENIKLLVNAHLKRACVYMHFEDSDKALDDFNTASSLDPANSDAAHQKAQILLMCEKLPEAISEFERAVNLNPKFAQSLVQKIYAEYRKAVMDRDVSKINSTKSALKRAVAKNPTCSEGYMLLAQMYADNQEYDEAESVFIQGTKSDPSNASLLVHLGMLYLQWKGDLENAVKYMEKAFEVDPKCELAYETLASVEAQRGNMLKSISLFDKALAFSKSEKEAAHILSLKAAAQAQHSVSATLGITFNKF